MFINIYSRRLQEPMGTTGNKITYFSLIKILIFIALLGLDPSLLSLDPFLYSLFVPIFSPIKSYINILENKKQIFLKNKGKSGIYIWINLINGKKYIGSSVDLSIRFQRYFNTNYLIKDNCMKICRSLLKYGYSKFKLEILEYCEPSKLLEREKYFIDLLSPEYNISLNPSSLFLGQKHSPEARQKMSEAKTGENNPMYGKNHTEETKTKMLEANKGEKNPMHGKPRPEGSGKPSQIIEVTDITNKTTIYYDSISAAARALNCNESSIRSNLKFNSNKPYKKIYMFAYKK